jgi:hypothetical protein
MWSQLVVQAAIKGEEHYQFFTYHGPTIKLPYRGIEVPLEKGQKFGVRKSADGKKIRLIFDDEVNRVFTLPLEVAQKIAKKVKVVK